VKRYRVSRQPLRCYSEVGLSYANLYTGKKELVEYFDDLDSLEEDLLLVAAGIFAADRATARREREDFHREIGVSFFLAHPERFERAKERLESVLHLLTHDSWQLAFAADPDASRERSSSWPREREGTTLLFSGGIDSLAAAVQRLEQPPLQLVSHHTRNTRTRAAQTSLVEGLRSHGFEGPHRSYFVSARDRMGLVGHGAEGSQRTRSFLFLVLGAISALHEGHDELLWIAENGILAIHLPLSAARVGAFSTHTAHPQVVAEIESFLGIVCERKLTITNPFLYHTKGEVTGIVADFDPELLFRSESCWMGARLPPETSHCGECIPCVHRHIAIEQHLKDRTGYRRRAWEEDVGKLLFDDEGRRNLVELTELIAGMRDYDDETAISTYIELVNPYLDLKPALQLHRRFSAEATGVLERYPAIARLLA